jgi:cytochrome P450
LFKLLMKAAKSNQNIEIQKDLLKYSVDVTSSLAFGVDINTLENGEDKLQDHLALVLPMVQRRMMIPVPYWRYLKLPIDYKLDKSLVIIKEAIHGFMKSAKSRIDADPGLKSNPTNFLEALLATQDEEGDKLTDEEVFTNVFSILLAGEDSTANSIAWVIHYMTELPEVQRRMQEEVDRIFGNDFSLLSFDQLQQLTYIEAVIQEALRLRPVLPIVQLCANEDMVISNVHVPKGTNVHLTMYNMFMNDDYFENSSDFNPDRWLSPDVSNKNGMKEAYLPFGFGPRICPGKSLALLESKAVLSMICRYFTVRKSNKEKDVTEKFSGVMQPVDLFVKIKLREHVNQELETMGATQAKGKCPMGYN